MFVGRCRAARMLVCVVPSSISKADVCLASAPCADVWPCLGAVVGCCCIRACPVPSVRVPGGRDARLDSISAPRRNGELTFYRRATSRPFVFNPAGASLHRDIVPLLLQGRALLLHWTPDHTHYEPVIPGAEGWRLPGVREVTGADPGSELEVAKEGRSLAVSQGASQVGNEGGTASDKSPRPFQDEPRGRDWEAVGPLERAEMPSACKATPRDSKNMIKQTTPHDASSHMTLRHRKRS